MQVQDLFADLRCNGEVSRVCLLIKIVSKTDVSAYDIVQNLFPDKSKDFVININEVEIALVKEIKPDTESRDLEKLASLNPRNVTTELPARSFAVAAAPSFLSPL